MTPETFWQIIDAGSTSDNPEDVLKKQLESLEPEEIHGFQTLFDEYFDQADRTRLWAAAYIINGGCSDDGFIDFRYALISKGRDVYENALDNPDSLAELEGEDEIDNELFGYVAGQVYEEKTGKDIPRELAKVFDEKEFDDEDDWDFEDEDENTKRLPKLMEKYW